MGIGTSKIQHVYGGSLSGLQNHKHQTQPHSHKKREKKINGEKSWLSSCILFLNYSHMHKKQTQENEIQHQNMEWTEN